MNSDKVQVEATNIKQRISALGESQLTVARESGVNRTVLNHFLRGNGTLSRETVAKIDQVIDRLAQQKIAKLGAARQGTVNAQIA